MSARGRPPTSILTRRRCRNWNVRRLLRIDGHDADTDCHETLGQVLRT